MTIGKWDNLIQFLSQIAIINFYEIILIILINEIVLILIVITDRDFWKSLFEFFPVYHHIK